MEKIAYRPLRRAPRLAPLITAIGMSIILQNVALMVWGRNYRTFPTLIQPTTHNILRRGDDRSADADRRPGGAADGRPGADRAAHRLGMAMRATAQNPQVAGLMGIDINVIISAAFVIGAALAAVAGLMVMAYYGIAHYYMGFLLGLKAFTAAVLGGIGNLAGAMLGGILLGHHRGAGRRLHRRRIERLRPFLAERCAAAEMRRERRTSEPVRQQLPGRVRVLRADSGADLPPIGPAGRTGRRSRMRQRSVAPEYRSQVWAGVALVAIALACCPSSPRWPARHGSASSTSR